MGPLVLNTRPDTDSAELLTELERRGYRYLSAPMLNINFPPIERPIDIAPYQGVVFTSANGVRAFIKLSEDRDLTAYCVGDATARMCKLCGFDDVYSANGDIHDLAALILKMVDAKQGPLLHPAARKPAGDLGEMLKTHGYQVDRQTVYEAQESKALPDAVINALRNHDIDAILFFSPRTAESFVKLVQRYNLQQDLSETNAICLSPAVQSKISDLTWHRTLVASQPTQEYLLSELGSLS